MKPVELATVSARTLSREPGKVLRRVEKGERLIVCRHGKPIGTLQPLNGVVEQPIEGRSYDVAGSPLLYPHAEVEKLSPLQRRLLAYEVRRDLVKGGGLAGRDEAVDDMELRGLVRRHPDGGVVLTGRGFVLREAIFEREGRIDPRYASRARSGSKTPSTSPVDI